MFLLFLYVAFRIKHFTCDFLLQSDWMALNKGGSGKEAYKTLFMHTSLHAVGTLIITMIVAPQFWWLSIIDFVVHSLIDRMKSTITSHFNWQPKDTFFWWALGADQELHNYTHLGFIIFITFSLGFS